MTMDDDDIKAQADRLIASGWTEKSDAEPLTPADYEWFWFGNDWWITKVGEAAYVARGCTLEELRQEVRKLTGHGSKVRRNRSRDTLRGPLKIGGGR